MENDEPLVKNKKLTKARNISGLKSQELIKKRVDFLYKNISDKYKIDEKEIYDVLYLKVRKMFLEEER